MSVLVQKFLNSGVAGAVLLKIMCSPCTAVCKGILRLEARYLLNWNEGYWRFFSSPSGEEQCSCRLRTL